MASLSKLWMDGGPVLYILLSMFVLALLAELTQLALARKVVFPRLFLGLTTAILAVATIGTAVGYRLAFDVLFASEMSQGATLRANEVALTPVLIGLGMVFFLRIIQMGVETFCPRELSRSRCLSGR